MNLSLRNSDRDLVYINALDTTDNNDNYYKTWEDVLDVIVKLRLPSGVTVLDMGTLRRHYLERNTGRNINVFFREFMFCDPEKTTEKWLLLRNRFVLMWLKLAYNNFIE